LHIEGGEAPAPIFEQGFENGLAAFTTSGNANWTSQTTNPYSGSRSAKSGAMGSNTSSSI